MNDLKGQLNTLAKRYEKITSFFASHAVFLFIIIASLAILAALLQSRSYLYPTRDEQKYTEGISEINYKSIDEEALKQLAESDNDPVIEVNPALVPDRNNPFAE